MKYTIPNEKTTIIANHGDVVFYTNSDGKIKITSTCVTLDRVVIEGRNIERVVDQMLAAIELCGCCWAEARRKSKGRHADDRTT